MMNDKILKRYLRDVSRELPCNAADRKRFLSDLRTQINDFARANGSVDYALLAEEFGSPQEIAEGFVMQCDTSEIARKMCAFRVSHRLFSLVCSLLLVLLLVISIYWTNLLHEIESGYKIRFYHGTDIESPLHSSVYLDSH